MVLLVVLVLLMLAGSFLCSLSEAALLASSEARIRARIERGERRAQRLLDLKRDPGRTLMSIVFLNNVFNVAGSALIAAVGADVIDTATGMFVLVALLTALVVLFGEIIPKILADALPEPIALRMAPALVFVRRALTPVLVLIEMLIGWARPRARVMHGEESEIRQLARLGHEGGHLHEQEADLIHRIFRLDDITAEDVMTPRKLVRAFRSTDAMESVKTRLLAANHSQFPVYEDDLDKVVGVLWLRDALAALTQGQGETTAGAVMRPALFVPTSRTVDGVMRDLQASHRRMAIVIDEYGITQGVITMDDLIEELVGEAIDETDVREGLVKRVSRTSALVHGLNRVWDVARFLNCPLEVDRDEETATVTGALQERLGRIPQVGDALELPGGLTLEVKEADARMAVRVLARRTAVEPRPSTAAPAPEAPVPPA
jgi:CBS domain containing-hemolysin-like protein